MNFIANINRINKTAKIILNLLYLEFVFFSVFSFVSSGSEIHLFSSQIIIWVFLTCFSRSSQS